MARKVLDLGLLPVPKRLKAQPKGSDSARPTLLWDWFDFATVGTLAQGEFRRMSEDLGAAFSYKGVTPAITDLIAWPEWPTDEWRKGFLAGVFDAGGSCSGGILRLRDGTTVFLSDHPHDIITAFVVFAKGEYGALPRGGTVIDGTGGPPVTADVAIAGVPGRAE